MKKNLLFSAWAYKLNTALINKVDIDSVGSRGPEFENERFSFA